MSFAPRADPLSKACNFKISVGPGRPTTVRSGADRPAGAVKASHRQSASTVPVRTRRRRRRAAASPSAGPAPASHRRSASTVPRPDAPAPAARSGATLRRAGPGLTSAASLHGAPSGRAGAGGAQRRHPPPGRSRPHIGGQPPRCPSGRAGAGGLQRRQAHRQAAHVGVGSPRATRSIRSFESRSFTIRDSDRNASRLEFSEFEIRIILSR
jgi:hypothetical protein